MNFKKFSLINAFIALASAKVGDINDFKDYPGIIELIEANTVDYAKNFIHTFTDGPIYSGNCLFPKEEYYEDMMYAALNNEQYNEDLGCGLCAVVVSTSNPYKAIRIRVIDQCPECEHGSLDFSDIAFKALSNKSPDRIKITWALIPCDVDVNEFPALVPKDAELKFQFKTGSTEFWGEVEVYNSLYPVVKVDFLQNGEYVSLYRRAYNYWALQSGGFGSGPYTFRVTLADNTIIEAKNVEMVIPSSDEGDEYSSGTQTIIQQSSTIQSRGLSGGNSSNKKTEVTPSKEVTKEAGDIKTVKEVTGTGTADANKKVSATATKEVVATATKEAIATAIQDIAATAIIETASTAIKETAVTSISETTVASEKVIIKTTTTMCPAAFINQGYECCEKDNCEVFYTDDNGDWGVNNAMEWCGIRNDCKSACPETFSSMGYTCCEDCTVYYSDESGDWGVENGEWCGIPYSCN